MGIIWYLYLHIIYKKQITGRSYAGVRSRVWKLRKFHKFHLLDASSSKKIVFFLLFFICTFFYYLVLSNITLCARSAAVSHECCSRTYAQHCGTAETRIQTRSLFSDCITRINKRVSKLLLQYL